jgi:hypothetical protein
MPSECMSMSESVTVSVTYYHMLFVLGNASILKMIMD